MKSLLLILLSLSLAMPAEPSADSLSYLAPSFEVEVEPDVVYARVEGYWSEAPERKPFPVGAMMRDGMRRRPLDLKMDIYLPAGDTSVTRPLLLMMHGGAFYIGNKQEKGQVAWCRHFASLGYVAVSIDYRLGFRPSKAAIRQAERDALEDADNALAYLLGRGDLRIDPERVFAAGTSAGAITALSLAYGYYGDQPPADPAPRLGPGFRIRAVGDLWGYVRDLSILERARVPLVAFQSERDPVVPFDRGYPLNARLFTDEVFGTKATCERAAELGIPCEHHPCPEKRHKLHLNDDWTLSPRYEEIRDAMTRFFAAVMESSR